MLCIYHTVIRYTMCVLQHGRSKEERRRGEWYTRTVLSQTSSHAFTQDNRQPTIPVHIINNVVSKTHAPQTCKSAEISPVCNYHAADASRSRIRSANVSGFCTLDRAED